MTAQHPTPKFDILHGARFEAKPHDCVHQPIAGLRSPKSNVDLVLSGEVRSGKSIAQDAGVLSREGNRTIEGINEWWEISERWENACRRWSEASTDFKNHLATRRSTLASPKSMAEESFVGKRTGEIRQ